MLKTKTWIFFFGPPGSGKGTQVDLLALKLKLPVISPGELLRHEEEINSEIGKKVKPLVDSGKMVPDSIVEKMIMNRLDKKDAKKGAIFDGFPRNKKQLDDIHKKSSALIKEKDRIAVLLIEVSDKEVIRRLSGRRVCDCGASYHLIYNPPKKNSICDICGNKITTRSDDKPSIIKERLKYYHKTIKPLLEYWEKDGKLHKIDGERPIKEIEKKITKLIKSLIE